LEPQNEVERLKTVYQQYRYNETIQRQWSGDNPGNRYILNERTRWVHYILKSNKKIPLTPFKILDVGCGSGNVLAGYLQWGACPENLFGIDLIPERIENAKHAFPELHFQVANAEQIEFPTAFFDLVTVFTVFTSILDDQMAAHVAEEIDRVLKPAGAVIWYDFRYNNPRNPHVRGMSRSKIQLLFPRYDLQLKSITLLPPLTRRFGKLTPYLYPLLNTVPFLRTHYLGLLIKPGA